MLELTLRSSVIVAGAWLLVRAMPRATAATRHLVWHSALLSVLVAPLLEPLMPKVRVGPDVPARWVAAVQRVQPRQPVQQVDRVHRTSPG